MAKRQKAFTSTKVREIRGKGEVVPQDVKLTMGARLMLQSLEKKGNQTSRRIRYA
ncbi:MAG: hypothetical protein PHH16_02250 [Candidatus Gracilibacteria bacterium]|nr:hypothetical protein [Candidatus Gracilibacteria bacterium]